MPSVRARILGDITSVAAIAALGLGVWLTATRQNLMRHEIERASNEQWKTKYTERWLEEFHRLNPELKLPNMDAVTAEE